MRKYAVTCGLILPFFLLMAFAPSAKTNNIHSRNAAEASIEGRWDITVDVDGKKSPSWLEVVHSGTKRLVGRYVGITGSARPISLIQFNGGKMSFTIPPQWEEEDNDLVFEATLQGETLSGTMVAANGKNLDGWKAMGNNQWVAEAGVLKSSKPGANLITEKSFSDFKLHVEFRYPKGSNSGIYLRGRYEVQIMDSKGMEPQSGYLGGVYGFVSPTEMVAKDPGEWQQYDITLTGRIITVVGNGKTIICKQEIPGITGGAIDSNEGEPGPLMIQGDHGPVELRNIVLTPAK